MNEKKNRGGEVERRGEAMDTQTGGGREGDRQTGCTGESVIWLV